MTEKIGGEGGVSERRRQAASLAMALSLLLAVGDHGKGCVEDSNRW